MSSRGSSKALSQRVEVGFHQRGRPYRRPIWILTSTLCAAALLWLGVEWLAGEQRHFVGGEISPAHHVFENDCAKCHDSWTPITRLWPSHAGSSSITNEKCSSCHEGAAHHPNQIPSHEDLSCAKCHREHQGKATLADVSNERCVACHGDLRTKDGSRLIHPNVEAFEVAGHPEFTLHRLLREKTNAPAGQMGQVAGGAQAVNQPVKFFARGEEPQRWQDSGRIKFNHSAHLRTRTGPNKSVEVGVITSDGRTFDYSQSCNKCHQPDASGRVMIPIEYKRHCAECHPLHFDVDAKPPHNVVPHETPEVVAGWLTDYYTTRVAKAGRPTDPKKKPDFAASRFPGTPALTDAEVERSRTSVQKAIEALTTSDSDPRLLPLSERAAKQSSDMLLKRSTGCLFCHERKAGPQVADQLPAFEPTSIPRTWLPSSRFDHRSHRTFSCIECHYERNADTTIAVHESKSTGDVLIPQIDTCYGCHASESTTRESSGISSHFSPATQRCVDCHSYHKHRAVNSDRGKALKAMFQAFDAAEKRP